MIRTLLTTTALTVLLTAGVMAQDAAPAATDAPATTESPADPAMAPADPAMAPADPAMAPADPAMAPADPAMAPADPAMAPADPAMAPADPAMDSMSMESFDMSAGYVAADTDNLGTRLIGQPVYSTAGDDAEEIGSISDLVFSDSGQITAVVIGVGGFLGIGEKSVAVDFQDLEFTIAADNTERWVLPTTAEALTSAPDFVWAEDEPADGAAPADAMAPADPAAAPADAMAPADPAAAPATN